MRLDFLNKVIISKFVKYFSLSFVSLIWVLKLVISFLGVQTFSEISGTLIEKGFLSYFFII
ncbi:hypothetical protein CKC_01830 [Candidatus Liberibacter solanacearum CLso-ZC1]|uniref:Transmembrane protein n=1 Tax=Liberibacter solanacearum (strain CLso-ZC1) TaxID=658172 RepID=E4UCM7_LIBSC|nr:hypothetical protein CKC_01830 [Candidatus Liberibacter solanacearum CLso-ZC1]